MRRSGRQTKEHTCHVRKEQICGALILNFIAHVLAGGGQEGTPVTSEKNKSAAL
jgi:hypothetical protein